ncbi:MAG: membrane protein insertase YidC [Acidobacteriota bacterium]
MEQLGQEDPKSTQRFVVAMVVMMALIGVWSLFTGTRQGSPPAPAPVPAAQGGARPPAESLAAPSVEAAGPAASALTVADTAERQITLESEDLRLVLSNRGAVLTRVELKKYRLKDGPLDELVSPLSAASGRYPLAIQSGTKAFDDAAGQALFHVEQRTGPAGEKVAEFSWSDGKGNAVRKVFTLPGAGYLLGFEASAEMDGKALSPVPLAWGPGFAALNAQQAKNRYFQQEYVGLLEAGSFKKVKRADKVTGDKAPVTDSYGTKGPIAWAAISNNYFAAALLPDAPMPWVRVVTEALSPELQKVHPAENDITLVAGFTGKGRLFLGPKQWGLLSGVADQFNRLTDWGWLTPLCGLLLWGLKKLYSFAGNYGIAIILITLLIKVAFYPLTQGSMVKMKQMGDTMKRLKPQVDRIKAKYKKMGKDMATRQKMNEEMMALYQKEGINPLGQMSGCLPLLLQMPIFFALFELLPRAIELRGAPFFGWIQDLSIPDPYYVTPLLMGATMIVSTRMSGSQGLEGAQKLMLWFMPVMFTWFCLWAPAGLTVYWLANNVLTMGQQALINRQAAARALEAEKARKSTPKGPSRPSRA